MTRKAGGSESSASSACRKDPCRCGFEALRMPLHWLPLRIALRKLRNCGNGRQRLTSNAGAQCPNCGSRCGCCGKTGAAPSALVRRRSPGRQRACDWAPGGQRHTRAATPKRAARRRRPAGPTVTGQAPPRCEVRPPHQPPERPPVQSPTGCRWRGCGVRITRTRPRQGGPRPPRDAAASPAPSLAKPTGPPATREEIPATAPPGRGITGALPRSGRGQSPSSARIEERTR